MAATLRSFCDRLSFHMTKGGPLTQASGVCCQRLAGFTNGEDGSLVRMS